MVNHAGMDIQMTVKSTFSVFLELHLKENVQVDCTGMLLLMLATFSHKLIAALVSSKFYYLLTCIWKHLGERTAKHPCFSAPVELVPSSGNKTQWG